MQTALQGSIAPGRAAVQAGRVHPQRAAGANALKTWAWGRTASTTTEKQKRSFFRRRYIAQKCILMHFLKGIKQPRVSALCLLAVQECQLTLSSGCQNQSVAKRHKTDITDV